MATTNSDVLRVFDTPANLASNLKAGMFAYDTTNDRLAVKRLADSQMLYISDDTQQCLLSTNQTVAGIKTFTSALNANVSINIGSTIAITGVLDEDDMASDSAVKLCTQQSIKKYVDDQVATADTWAEVLANGNTSGATDVVIDSGQSLTVDTDTLAVNVSGYTDKVGIGTTTPATTLDVAGAITVRGSTEGISSSSNTTWKLTWSGGTDAGTFYLYDNNAIVSKLSANGDSYLSGGNLGIGTSTPSSEIEIDKDQNDSTGLLITNANTGNASSTSIVFVPDGSNFNITAYGDSHASYADKIRLFTTAAGTDISLETGTGDILFTTNGTQAAAIDTSQKIALKNGTGIDEFSTDGTMAGNSDDAVPTEKAIVTYVAAQITAEDLDIAGDSGTGSVDLNSQSLTIAGTANEIETSAASQTLTIGLPDDVTIGSDLTVTDSLIVDTTTLVVNASGYADKVGIGTATPVSTLEVSGSAPFQFRVNDSDSTDQGLDLGYDATSLTNAYIYNTYTGDPSSKINIGFGTSAGSGIVTTFTQGGDVGIGTDSPITTVSGIVLTVSDAKPTILLEDTDVATATVGRAHYLQNIDGALKIYRSAVSAGGTSNSELSMAIDSSGNVGIGTATPDGTLHVHTATAGAVSPSSSADDLTVENSTDAGISILTPDANYSILNFGSASDNEGASINFCYDDNAFNIGSSKSGAAVAIKSGDGANGIIIDSSQNVGITDSSPDAKLCVNVSSGTGLIQSLKSDSSIDAFTYDSTTFETDTFCGMRENENGIGGLLIVARADNSEGSIDAGIRFVSSFDTDDVGGHFVFNATKNDSGSPAFYNGVLFQVEDNANTEFKIEIDENTVDFDFSSSGSSRDTVFNFQSSSNVGEFTWDVGDDRFIFSDDILISSGEKLYFGDANSSIEYVPPNGTGGHMLISDSEKLDITCDDVCVNFSSCGATFKVISDDDEVALTVVDNGGTTISNTTDDGGLTVYGDTALKNNLTIGEGGSGVDYTLTIDGDGADFLATWMEGEDYLAISDELLMNTSEKIHFRDTAIGIYSQADTYLDLFADGAVRIGDSSGGAPTDYIKIEDEGEMSFHGKAGMCFGELFSDTGDTITISASGQANKIQFTGFNNNGNYKNMTCSTVDDSITVDIAGKYLVNISMCIDSVDSGACQIVLLFGYGSTFPANLRAVVDFAGGGGEAQVVSMTGVVSLAATSECKIYGYNETNANDIAVEFCSFNMTEIAGQLLS